MSGFALGLGNIQDWTPVSVQCERFFLKLYNPFFLVQVLVPILETARVNTTVCRRQSLKWALHILLQ